MRRRTQNAGSSAPKDRTIQRKISMPVARKQRNAMLEILLTILAVVLVKDHVDRLKKMREEVRNYGKKKA